MAQAHAGMASHGAQFFAYDQWAGKGQRGKSWASIPGSNIILSTVIEPVNLPISQPFALSIAVALACWDLFSGHAGTEDTRIKWPNDLYWRDRKAGGILIENSFQGSQWIWAIVGTGININQTSFPPEARNPVSLKQITGRTFDAARLARDLGGHMDHRYGQLEDGKAAILLDEYNSLLFRRGEKVRLKKDNAIFETEIRGVDAAGLLYTRDTLDREFNFGEVEWIF